MRPLMLPDDAFAIARAAEVVARAFVDNPLARYIEPDPRRRAVALDVLFGTFMPFFRSSGLVQVTPGRIRAVAVWRLPLDGLVTPLESLGPTPPLDHDQLNRFRTGQAQLDALLAATFDEPAWYLDFLAADPPYQGRGLGTALIADVHAQADRTGIACLLETFDGPNVTYYEHRGYEVAGTGTVSFATERAVAMRRSPTVAAR